MDVRQAVAAAKSYLREIFSEEPIENLGLEEVEFDDTARVWSITYGFSRPWDKPIDSTADRLFPFSANKPTPWPREYKVVRVLDETGQILSIKNRETTHA